MTPYLRFHPGGTPLLLKIAGKDGTALFNKYHAWVRAGTAGGPYHGGGGGGGVCVGGSCGCALQLARLALSTRFVPVSHLSPRCLWQVNYDFLMAKCLVGMLAPPSSSSEDAAATAAGAEGDAGGAAAGANGGGPAAPAVDGGRQQPDGSAGDGSPGLQPPGKL